MKKYLISWIERGTEFTNSDDEQIRIRQVNLLNALIIVMIMIVTPYIYLTQHSLEYPVLILTPFMLLGLWLNQHGKFHLARIVSLLTVILLTYPTVLNSPTQIPAPLANFIIAFSGYFLMTRKTEKVIITVFALITYFITEYYNLKYLPFDDLQYLPTAAFLIFSYIAISFVDNERTKNKRTILEQYEELDRKNEEIQKQSELLILAKEKEKDLLELQIIQNNQELSDFAIKEVERQRLLTSIKNKIDKISDQNKDLQDLKKLIKSSLKPENGWDNFFQKFETIYPDFFKNLNRQFEKLTLNDLKLCGYIKVGMNNYEIINVTNVEYSTIKKSLNRLKKKLELGAEDDLRDFILQFA